MAALIVDTNILLDIYTQDQIWEERSAAAIASAADVAVLVINPIIYAELSVGIEKIEELINFLERTFGEIRFHGRPLSSLERRFALIAGEAG